MAQMAMTILKMAMMVRSFIEENNTFLKARLQTQQIGNFVQFLLALENLNCKCMYLRTFKY